MAENKGARCRLLFMLCLTASFFFIEITVGYITNSMALVADSFHMLSDVIALVIAYVSVRISPKKWSKNTFGWARAEVLGALVNAVFLCALCFSIFVESIKRFYKPESLHDPELILVVGVCGLLVNVIGLFLFKDGGGHGHSHGGGGHGHSHGGGGHHHSHGVSVVVTDDEPSSNRHHHHHHNHKGHQHLPTLDSLEGGDNVSSREASPHPIIQSSPTPDSEIDSSSEKDIEGTSGDKQKKVKKPASSAQMNMRGVFLHVLADALGSVIVCISACIIMFTGFEYKDYVDPFLSVLMVALIMYSTWGLLVESAMILLQTVPTHIQIDSLQRKLLQEIDGVLAVHEFHVWQLAGDRIISSAHIRCHNPHDYMQIAEKVKEFFHNEGIHSTTIQPEFVNLESEYKWKDGSERSVDHNDCVLDCPKTTENVNGCINQTCCGPQQGKDSPKTNQNGVLNNSSSSTPKFSKKNKSSSQHELNSTNNEFVEVVPSDREKSRSAEDMV